MADYDDDDELFKDLYGDEDNTATAAQPTSLPLQSKSAPPEIQSPQQEQGQRFQEQQYQSDIPTERATDPRKQPASAPAPTSTEDPDRELARNGGAMQQYNDTQSQDQTPLKDTRPDPNKHEDGKMFIGGLNWETTDESMRAYFEQFGEITECTVMRENQTGRSRGFGFLTFKDPKCVNAVMVKEHILDGKIIDPKRAIPRDEQDKTSKIFVGGIGQDVVEEEFKEYFEQFGTVLDATLMMDKETGRPRGFGFITFDDDSAVENCMTYGPLAIKGKMIEVKRAQPKGRERDQGMDRRPYDRGDRNYPGGGGGGGNFGQNTGFNASGQGMMNQQMYGGMTPALMAQWYQNMRAYYAAMGRGMVPGMGMGTPMMGMPNMNMQGMGMAGGMPGQMMGMPQGMGAFQGGMPMNQGFGSPNQQPYQQEMSSHDGEYTYDTGSEQQGGQHSPPQSMSPEATSREGPPPNAPTGPSGLKPSYGGPARGGRGGMRGVGRGYGGGSFPGGMPRGGNVRFNPYGR